jgi:hypothetical protein
MRVPIALACKLVAALVPLSAFAALSLSASPALSQGRAAPSHTARIQRPADCASGYVWREAFHGDYVCVTPEVRQQASEDNGQAGARVSPSGGAYGPDTCSPGYVWREASPSDHVCVTPETRQRAAEDNARAHRRRSMPFGTLGQLPRADGAAPAPDPAGNAPCGEVVTHTLDEYGMVVTEVHRPDGVIEQRSSSGTTTIYPDGRREFRRRDFIEAQAPAATPPMLSTDPQLLQRWREYHAESLLEIFKRLAENDPEAYDKLMRSEEGMTLYQKINRRTQIIQGFLSR